MHDARSSRTLVIASIRAVSRSCHRRRHPRPVALGRRVVDRQGREGLPDLGEGEAEPLAGPHHGDAAQRVPLEPPLVARGAHRRHQPALLVEPHRRHRHPGALGHLTDGEQVVSVHAPTVVDLTSSALEVRGWRHDDLGDRRTAPTDLPDRGARHRRADRRPHRAPPRPAGPTAPVRLLDRANLPVVVGIVALVTLAAFENRAVMHDPADRRARARRLGPVRRLDRRHARHLHRSPWPGRAAGPTASGRARCCCGGWPRSSSPRSSRASRPTMTVFVAGRAVSGAAEALIDTSLMVLVAQALPDAAARQGVRVVRRRLDPALAARAEPGRRHRRPVGVAGRLRRPAARRPGRARRCCGPALRRTHAGGATADGCRRRGIRAPSGGRGAAARRRARRDDLLGPAPLRPRHARARCAS